MSSWQEDVMWIVANGFHIIKIIPLGKIPLAHSNHTKGSPNCNPSLDYNDAIDWIMKGGNLAIRADERCFIDFDRRVVPFNADYYRQFNTVVSFSHGGYHLYYDNPRHYSVQEIQTIVESKYKNVKIKHGKKSEGGGDVVHIDNGYVIAPPSRVKQKDDSIYQYHFLDDRKVIYGITKLGALQ